MLYYPFIVQPVIPCLVVLTAEQEIWKNIQDTGTVSGVTSSCPRTMNTEGEEKKERREKSTFGLRQYVVLSFRSAACYSFSSGAHSRTGNLEKCPRHWVNQGLISLQFSSETMLICWNQKRLQKYIFVFMNSFQTRADFCWKFTLFPI